MNDVKIAIPFEMAETIMDYCNSNSGCSFCIFANRYDICEYSPYLWHLDEMRVEDEDNGK